MVATERDRLVPVGAKRTPDERERDMEIVSKMYLQGHTIAQITKHLNERDGIPYTISAATVSRDHQELLARWQEQQLDKTDQNVNEQLARIKLVELEAWGAWKRSREPLVDEKVVKRLREVLDDEGRTVQGDELIVQTIERMTREQVGGENFLRIILDCVEKRARLLGLYQQKLQITNRDEREVKVYAIVSPAQWDDPRIQVVGKELYYDGEIVPDEKIELLTAGEHKGDG